MYALSNTQSQKYSSFWSLPLLHFGLPMNAHVVRNMMNNNRIYGIISEINGIENVWISNELDTFVNGQIFNIVVNG